MCEYHSILQVTSRSIIIQQCKTCELFLSSIYLTLTVSTRYSVPYATPHFINYSRTLELDLGAVLSSTLTILYLVSVTIRYATAQIKKNFNKTFYT